MVEVLLSDGPPPMSNMGNGPEIDSCQCLVSRSSAKSLGC